MLSIVRYFVGAKLSRVALLRKILICNVILQHICKSCICLIRSHSLSLSRYRPLVTFVCFHGRRATRKCTQNIKCFSSLQLLSSAALCLIHNALAGPGLAILRQLSMCPPPADYTACPWPWACPNFGKRTRITSFLI